MASRKKKNTAAAAATAVVDDDNSESSSERDTRTMRRWLRAQQNPEYDPSFTACTNCLMRCGSASCACCKVSCSLCGKISLLAVAFLVAIGITAAIYFVVNLWRVPGQPS